MATNQALQRTRTWTRSPGSPPGNFNTVETPPPYQNTSTAPAPAPSAPAQASQPASDSAPSRSWIRECLGLPVTTTSLTVVGIIVTIIFGVVGLVVTNSSNRTSARSSDQSLLFSCREHQDDPKYADLTTSKQCQRVEAKGIDNLRKRSDPPSHMHMYITIYDEFGQAQHYRLQKKALSSREKIGKYITTLRSALSDPNYVFRIKKLAAMIVLVLVDVFLFSKLIFARPSGKYWNPLKRRRRSISNLEKLIAFTCGSFLLIFIAFELNIDYLVDLDYLYVSPVFKRINRYFIDCIIACLVAGLISVILEKAIIASFKFGGVYGTHTVRLSRVGCVFVYFIIGGCLIIVYLIDLIESDWERDPY